MVTMRSGRENVLYDTTGKAWLDMQSGILNTPLGHGSTAVSYALQTVVHEGLINSYDRAPYAAGRLTDLMSEYKPGYVWKLFNSGGEAIDKAIQIASTVFQRPITVAVLPGAFHGKLLSMSYGHYGDKLPWGNPLNLITYSADANFDVLIWEPVQGHSGQVWDEEILRRRCDMNGALLIADEMITGFLRCGKRFMSETADIIVTGKGISGGAPLSLVGFTDRIKGCLPQGEIPVGWRSTGVGNNLCASIGLTVLRELITREDYYLRNIQVIRDELKDMGFSSVGAFGFKILNDFQKARAVFEDFGVIASWHNAPFVRVGPSFVTPQEQLNRLKYVLIQAGEL